MKKTRSPLLSLESSRPLAEFNLVLATVSFENDAPNLAAMLERSGLGMRSAGRSGPLVIAGGVAPMLNPEPMAELVDGFLLGDAEAVLLPFMDKLREHQGMKRRGLLLKLAQETPGFYAPCFYEPSHDETGRLIGFEPLADLPRVIHAPKYQGPAEGLARSVFNAEGPEFGQMRLLEVGRGCAHGCRFCAAGHIFRPPRLGKASDFMAPALEAASEGIQVGLVSAAVSDLPQAAELGAKVNQAGGRLSVSSLRADRIDPELAACLAGSRHQTVALAPEAGSQRLRRALNKNLDEDDLFSAVETLIRAGVPNLRLYFMVGLPGEDGEDIGELISLVRRMRQQVVSHSRAKRRLGRVTISLNAFVPKPFTPFQWEPMAPLKLIDARMNRIKKELGRVANLKVIHDVPKYAQLQAVFSRGDRRLAPLIESLARGARPNRAYQETGLSPEFYAHRRRELNELLPWSHVDHGLSVQYLFDELQRSREAKLSPACNPGKCQRCQACGQI